MRNSLAVLDMPMRWRFFRNADLLKHVPKVLLNMVVSSESEPTKWRIKSVCS